MAITVLTYATVFIRCHSTMLILHELQTQLLTAQPFKPVRNSGLLSADDESHHRSDPVKIVTWSKEMLNWLEKFFI